MSRETSADGHERRARASRAPRCAGDRSGRTATALPRRGQAMSDIIVPPAPQPSSTAVEVVATFGDTVIGVKHVTDPRGGRVTATTRALLVGGALALAGAFAGFAYAAKVAADDDARKAQLIAEGRPEWAFRAHLMPASADVAFALAGSLGLCAMVWGLA